MDFYNKLLESSGYIIYENFITEDKLNDLKDIDIFSQSLPCNIFYNNDNKVKQIQHLEHIPSFYELGETIRKFVGGVSILNMQCFIKHHQDKLTIPHQDGAYFGGDNYVTFWIPVQNVTKYNSCLWYLVDSHKKGLIKHTETGQTTRTRSGVTGKSLSIEYNQDWLNKFIEIHLNKTSVICHHPYTFHYSNVNSSLIPRISFTCIIKLF